MISTINYQIWNEKGILFISFSKNVSLSKEILHVIKTDIMLLSKLEPMPVLLDFSSINNIDADARKLIADKTFMSRINAVAFLVKDVLQKLLVQSILMVNRPAFPAKMFEKKEEGEQWLSFYKWVN
ncbi:MAG: hypothetical protein ACK4ND_04440 [Cytophagaceae bacterium]